MIKDFFKRLLRRRDPGRVVLVADGFVWRSTVLEVKVRWSQVGRIEALKRDDLTYDTLYLEIDHDDTERLLLSDDVVGFSELTAALEINLPDVLEGWYAQVTETPFAENRTLVFERDERRDGAASSGS